MSGLPGVGKSAIADALAVHMSAVVVSVDELEAAMLRSGIERSFETGLAAYNAGATIAAHQLRLGVTVIADAANYLEVGRQIWCSAAEAAGAGIRAIEVVCSDERLHRERLAARARAPSSPSPNLRGQTSFDSETRPRRGREIVSSSTVSTSSQQTSHGRSPIWPLSRDERGSRRRSRRGGRDRSSPRVRRAPR